MKLIQEKYRRINKLTKRINFKSIHILFSVTMNPGDIVAVVGYRFKTYAGGSKRMTTKEPYKLFLKVCGAPNAYGNFVGKDHQGNYYLINTTEVEELNVKVA